MNYKKMLSIILISLVIQGLISTTHVFGQPLIITLKWRANAGTSSTWMGPLATDLNNDGLMEIVITGKNGIAALNPLNGSVIWSQPYGGDHVPCEIIDLNKDGIPEILMGPQYINGSSGGVLALHGNNGSVYWYNPNAACKGTYIAVADINADGYPEIYTATPGSITALTYDGRIFASTWTYYTCWGGMTIGDTDFDGVFEVYLGERYTGYDPSARGLRAFWADNLTEIWAHPDILCSSQAPVLADVDKDGDLEIIVLHQRKGIAVINTDGSPYRKQLTINDLPSNGHTNPTIADVDNDGNLELLHCGQADLDWYTPAIFDLVNWKVEATLPFKSIDPPGVADIDGDGKLEIIAPNQNNVTIFKYNPSTKNYDIIGTIPLATAHPFFIAQDIDADGKLELIFDQYNSWISVYDVETPAPTPLPRSGLYFYSQYRTRVPVYVPPPGPQAPIIAEVSPNDGATNIPITLSQLSFKLTDYQCDPINYTVITNPDIGSASDINVPKGKITVPVSGLAHSTTYTWTVTATDGTHTTTKTYRFSTTVVAPWYNTDWQYRREIMIDYTKVAGDQTNFPVVIDLTDSSLTTKAQPDGDDFLFTDENGVKLSHEIELYDSTAGHLIAWVKVPYLSSTTNTRLYLYYDNSKCGSQQDPTAVWDTNNVLVLHLDETHECRMWGMVSDALPYDIVMKHLVTDTNSIKNLGASNRDGWGMVWYPYSSTSPEIRRGYPPANTDPNFDAAAMEMASSGAPTGVAHVRSAASGGIPPDGNPHPFMRFKNGKWWAFCHNGVLNKNNLKSLIGAEYLAANPPNYGTSWDDPNVIDTDLFHLYVMKCIEQSNWDVLTGIAKAISDITSSDSGAANFILTDGTTIWAFRKGNTLSYYYQSTSPTYSVVASQPPDPTQTGWTSMSDYNLVILTRNNAPYLISNIRQFKLLVDATFDDSADNADLRANATTQDWYESRNNVPTLLYLDTANVGGNTGKKAGFTASDSGNAYLTQEFGAPQTGVFSVQWDIYVDSILDISGNPDRAGWMLIGDNYDTSTAAYQTPNYPPTERFVYLAFFKNGGGTSGTMDLVALNSTSFTAQTVIKSGLNLKQWYTIKVIVDVPAKTYDVYIDDVFIAKVGTAFTRNSVTHISFAQWNDGAGAFYVDNVYAPAPISMHKITINVIGEGTVTKSPDMATYAYGTSVKLTAIPGEGYGFAGWTGDYVGTTNPVTITMDGDKEITATFTKQTYTLSITIVGSGSVTKSPDLPTYNYGDQVTLTATPNSGYKFVTWSGDLSGTANPAVIKMTGNKVVIATFLPEGTSVCVDSSSYGHIGLLYGDVTQGATGVIDGAYTFDGVNDYIEFAHSDTLSGFTQGLTISFWLKLEDTNRRQVILGKYNTGTGQRSWYIDYNPVELPTRPLTFYASSDGTNLAGEWYANFVPAAGVWYYVTLVWEANTTPKFYINGQALTIGTRTISSIYNNVGVPLHIARSTYNTARYLKGSLDEIRISNIARSAGYILTCYNNQLNPATFYSIGREESLPPAPLVLDPNPATEATNVPLTLAELSFSLKDYQNDLMSYEVSTTPYIGGGSDTGVGNGRYSVPVSNLQPSTTYTWEVNVTDGTHSTTVAFTFTTLTPLLQDSEFNESVDDADLRANGAGQDWYESRAQRPTLLFLDQTNVGGNTGKKAGFTASSSYNAYLTQEFSSEQTGVFSVQWDIYVDSILNLGSYPDRAGIMLIGADVDNSGGPNRNDAERFVFLAFWKDGGATSGTAQLVWMKTFNNYYPIATVNLDQWHTIKVVVNVPAGKYDVYLDGEYIATVDACTKLSKVTHISFAQWNDGAGAFYVDNVFSPAIDRYRLTVNTVGSGSVTKTPGESTYAHGALVTLSANPAPGWYFDSWSGDASGNANPTTIKMDSDKTITAIFTQNYTLTVNIVGSGTVSKNPNQTSYTPGTVVTLTATPAQGWSFSDWSGDLTGNDNPATITMNSSKVVTATFTPLLYTLTVNVDGNGQITKTPDQETYMYGTVVTLEAVPDPGWTFTSWSGDLTGTTNPTTIIMTGNKEVTATFTQLEYTLSVTVDPSEGGSVNVDPAEPYHYGDIVQLEAVPTTGWYFAGWSGDLSGSTNPTTITMDGNKVVTATFTKVGFTLTVNVVGSGTVTVSPEQPTYDPGTEVTLTANPALGWSFTGWGGDLIGNTNPATVTMDSNKVITATFTEDQYTLGITVVGNGQVAKNPDQTTYTYDTIVTLTATADPGWTFEGWSGDLSGSESPITITMTGNKAVTATFTQDQYTLTLNVSPEGGGSVTKTPNQPTYTYGTVVQLTATPEPGYAFSHWTDDISSDQNPEYITITGNKVVTAVFVWTQTNWWNPAWKYRRTITIDRTKVGGELTDFPVLIEITDSSLTGKAQTDGDDFVFTDANNMKLDHQIELYDSPTGHIIAWVKVPHLSSTVDTVLYMYYGNSNCGNQQNPTGVWDANYKLVMHLNEGTGVHYDSTINSNNGAPFGSLVQGTTGYIGSCVEFNGGYIQLPRVLTTETQFTFSAWIYPRSGSRYVISEWWSYQGAFLQIASDKTAIEFYVNNVIVSSTSITLNNWYYIVGTYDGTTARLYVNNRSPTSVSTSSPIWPSQNMYIGDRSDHVRKFYGFIDEVRVSNTARSAAWILTEYNNQLNPTAFYTIGTEEQQAAQNLFTLVVLPDTQYYSQSYPAIFTNQTQWIIDNAASMNMMFVLHEGDLVNNDVTYQWQNAYNSMSLLNGYVPWAVLPGNHDGTDVGGPNENLANYNAYFSYSLFSSELWYGGAYNNINTNSFTLFSGGNDDYIIFNFQYHPSDAVLAWANATIAAYPDRRAIVVTHDYLNTDGTRTTEGDHIWNNFIIHHADQIFLVLCGHMHSEAKRQDTVNGHIIYQVLADYQERTNGGNGWLRIIEFHPAEDKIYIKTFSPYLNSYENDADSQFVLSYDMTEPN